MIHVVLLAYNEAESLPKLVPDISRVLSGQNEPFRIIVMDDGSKDGTAHAAEALVGDFPVVVVRHEVNRGVAKAFDTSLRFVLGQASADDLVFTMEGDRTNDPACLTTMISALHGGADVVCASRYLSGGAYVGFPLKRRLCSLAANILAKLVLRVPNVRDYTIFYRGYRASVLRRGLDKYGERFIECRGFASNAEILAKIAQAGPLVCAEVPFVYRYDLKPGPSKMRIASNTAEYFKLFWRTFVG